MTATRKALVSGATGVVGGALIRHLAAQPDWDVVAVSRRAPVPAGRWIHAGADLEDPAASRRALGDHADATHLFHCAFVQDPDPLRHVARNTALLVHFVEAALAAGAPLQHVHVVQGTKWYGSHLGPFTTPAREWHPRHAGSNFYFDQQDWLEAAQRGQPWTWSATRPHAVCGFSLGSPMNLALSLAVYGSLCRELGLPFSHPGPEGNWHALYQVTDAGLLARAMVWAATTPACANQAFNVTNGDLIRWKDLWPRLAHFFGLEPGPQRHFSLREALGGMGEAWAQLTARHGLLPHSYEAVAGWGFADFVFGSTWDIASDCGRIRRTGFCETLDSEEMLLDLLGRWRAGRVIP